MSKDREPLPKFKGFQSPNYTIVPDELFDELLPTLSGSELKVLLYIIRRTFGFKKDADSISLSQMLNGITTKDGRVLDRGAGLSKGSLIESLSRLKEREVILTERQRSADRGDEPTIYRLNIVGSTTGPKTDHPVVQKLTTGPGTKTDHPVVSIPATQETVLQETVEQDISKFRRASHAAENVDNSEERSDREASEASTFRRVPTGKRAKGNGEFTTVSDVVRQKTFRRSRQEYDEARAVILEYIADFAPEMGDEATLSASVTRAVNLYRRSGRELGGFTAALYEARSKTKEYTANIKKRRTNADGSYAPKAKMAYYFAILEDVLGLREDASHANRGGRRRSPSHEPEGDSP